MPSDHDRDLGILSVLPYGNGYKILIHHDGSFPHDTSWPLCEDDAREIVRRCNEYPHPQVKETPMTPDTTRRVSRYDICSAESPPTLAADVGVLLDSKEGWVPFGSMTCYPEPNSATGWMYHQPMVVYGDGEVIP